MRRFLIRNAAGEQVSEPPPDDIKITSKFSTDGKVLTTTIGVPPGPLADRLRNQLGKHEWVTDLTNLPAGALRHYGEPGTAEYAHAVCSRCGRIRPGIGIKEQPCPGKLDPA